MLARRIGLFDATMVVMGGIVGSGIFVNPAIVARNASAPWMMIAGWLTGRVAGLPGAYGGFQTACFVAAELKEPSRDLPRALIGGVLGVIALYLLTVLACLRALGPAGLAATGAPAHDVAVRALGAPGGALIAAGIAISTLGFLSQSILTAPRVYFAMAQDGVFFR